MEMTRFNSGFLPSFFGNLENDLFDRKLTNTFSKVAVNISERESDYLVEMAAPGFDKEDINIEVEGNKLIIKGSVSSEKEEKEENYTHKEFSYGEFTRSFTLPKDIDTQNIGADYKDGILKITVPKPTEKQKLVKRIEIKG